MLKFLSTNSNVALLSFLLITGCGGSSVNTISAHELHEALARNEIVLIDVRSDAEHQSDHIESDIHIPLSALTADKIQSYDKPIVFYCHSGNRSMQAIKKVGAQLPTTSMRSLTGGISAWRNAGY